MIKLSPEALRVITGARADSRLTGLGSGEVRELVGAGLLRHAPAAESRERVVMIVTRKGETFGRERIVDRGAERLAEECGCRRASVHRGVARVRLELQAEREGRHG